jgi:hypothetical protein
MLKLEANKSFKANKLSIIKTFLTWKTKDAGFVYKSLQNETNRVIWKKNFHEMNPRHESFKNESTKRIHDTNLLKTWRIRDPRYETNPDSSITKRNVSFKVRIRDARYGTNPWIRETNPCFYESLIRIPQPYERRIFAEMFLFFLLFQLIWSCSNTF